MPSPTNLPVIEWREGSGLRACSQKALYGRNQSGFSKEVSELRSLGRTEGKRHGHGHEAHQSEMKPRFPAVQSPPHSVMFL